jgi:metallo-beta-lactamase family protein
MTYITHGEPEGSEALRVRIKRQLGWRARVPEHLDKISLEDPR